MKYEVELTYHASEERIDRLATIIEHLSVVVSHCANVQFCCNVIFSIKFEKEIC